MEEKGIHLIIISVIVFSVLNIIENLLHYNIGRSHNKNFDINLPTLNEFIHIIGIMLLFGFLQGLLTEYFTE